MARTLNRTSKISAFFKIDLNLDGVTRVRWLSIRYYSGHWINKRVHVLILSTVTRKIFFICKVNVVEGLEIEDRTGYVNR